MARDEENTVSAIRQLKYSESIFGEDGAGKRILFLGNSITKHDRNEAIGWLGTWGMAASSEEKDYVHQTMRLLRENAPDTAYLAAQIAPWEVEFWNPEVLKRFQPARDFKADIIVVRVIENVSAQNLDKDLCTAFGQLVDFMNPGNAKILLTTSFWPHEAKDAILRQAAEKYGWKLLEIGDLGRDDRYTAKGLFEHRGVAAHPGDAGMLALAERIVDAIREWM